MFTNLQVSIDFFSYINLSSDVLKEVLEMDVTEAVVGVARINTTLVYLRPTEI